MEHNSIFLTGAASGIGRATAELFHSKGWFV
ncbi:MAG: short-chain dehydrogenase, partial [Gammaproteobacteria bacterium]|nr:short-chain dehydrogenase [Gammaproteobacteria bacterium]